jgi:hypothetical protein
MQQLLAKLFNLLAGLAVILGAHTASPPAQLAVQPNPYDGTVYISSSSESSLNTLISDSLSSFKLNMQTSSITANEYDCTTDPTIVTAGFHILCQATTSLATAIATSVSQYLTTTTAQVLRITTSSAGIANIQLNVLTSTPASGNYICQSNTTSTKPGYNFFCQFYR